jgi:putative tricarboxylic transport membrane protein
MDKRIDLVGVIFVIGLGIFYLVLAERLPNIHLGDPMGPGGFPKYLAIGIMATGFLLLVSQITKWRRASGWMIPPEGVADDPEHPVSTWRVFVLIVITFLYLYLLPVLGYLFATPAFLGAVLALHGIRHGRLLITVSMSFTIILFVVFGFLARVRLPLGPLEFLNDWIAMFFM